MKLIREQILAYYLVLLIAWTAFTILFLDYLHISRPQTVFYPLILLTSVGFRSIFFPYIVPALTVLLIIAHLRRRGLWLRAIAVAIIAAIVCIGAAFVGYIIAGLFESHNHEHSIVVHNHVYHLTRVNRIEMRCDRLCYPPDFTLFECDSLGIDCRCVVYLSPTYYDENGPAASGVYVWDTVGLRYLPGEDEIEILLDGDPLFKYPLLRPMN